MKLDEFPFFNQQLAAMLRDGIPLESALQRLSAEMSRGSLRVELEKLSADLAKGKPLSDAIGERSLPDLYRQMIVVGTQSNDLPGILTMLADYYQRRHVIATRLKGLMVYPVIVLCAAFLLSLFLAILAYTITSNVQSTVFNSEIRSGAQQPIFLAAWGAPIVLGIAVVLGWVAVATPKIRRSLRWKLPAFKETSLSQLAGALAMMLKSGVPLDGALALVEQLERGTPAAPEIGRWRSRLALGQGKFFEMASGSNLFPPLFVWTISQSSENLSEGFQRAAEMYRLRAGYRTETLLYSALPCSILALGIIILTQIAPLFVAFANLANLLSDN